MNKNAHVNIQQTPLLKGTLNNTLDLEEHVYNFQTNVAQSTVITYRFPARTNKITNFCVITRLPHDITKDELCEAINNMEPSYIKAWRIYFKNTGRQTHLLIVFSPLGYYPSDSSKTASI